MTDVAGGLDASRFTPWFSALDVSPPEEVDLHLTELLKQYIDDVLPLETPEEQQKKINMLRDLGEMVNDWVLGKLEEKHIIFDGDEQAAGKIFISGSYRLGVSSKGSDIDTIVTVPRDISRDEFFSEESGFVAVLRKRPGVTYVNAVTSAKVPIIEVVWDEIELDVLCCVIANSAIVPQEPKELLDDSILFEMDEVSMISINGPRVTELTARLVPNMETFKLCLRCIRVWAKNRGLYSNKMGFLGGVNFQILVAFVCQLFPTATPFRLLKEFFELCRAWKWPTEIRLCHPYPVPELDLEQFGDRRTPGEIMPIITPAYPCRNSSYNVSKATLAIMVQEFALAEKKCKAIRRKKDVADFNIFAPLFEKSEFFVRYQHYVVVHAACPDEDTLARWSGWIESRIRKLVDEIQRFPVRQIHPYPKKITLSINQDGKQHGYWYIGILRHPIFSERAGHSMDLTSAVGLWLSGINRWESRTEDMEASVSINQWKQLPDDKELFPSGKQVAKESHKRWMKNTKLEQEHIKSLSGDQTQQQERTEQEDTTNDGINEDESKEIVKQEKENENKLEEMLGKRLRDAKEATEANKKVQQITNIFDLPVLDGINTTTPISILI